MIIKEYQYSKYGLSCPYLETQHVPHPAAQQAVSH